MFDLNDVYEWMVMVGIEKRGLLLGLAVAYLAYAVFHTLDELLDRYHDVWSTLLRRAAELVLTVTIYVVSFIYGLEYILETFAHA